MSKKNYRRREVLNEWNFGLKQRFNIKCGIDLTVFIAILAIFISYSLRHDINPYEGLGYVIAITAVFIPLHFITKQWINRSIRKSLTLQSETLSSTTSEIIETLNSQKKVIVTFSTNSKNISFPIVSST